MSGIPIASARTVGSLWAQRSDRTKSGTAMPAPRPSLGTLGGTIGSAVGAEVRLAFTNARTHCSVGSDAGKRMRVRGADTGPIAVIHQFDEVCSARPFGGAKRIAKVD